MKTTARTARLVEAYAAAKLVADAAKAAADEAAAALIAALGEGGKAETATHKVTVVVSETLSADIDALRAAASPSVFKRITKVSLDPTAYRALASLDSVPAAVAEVVVARPSKPSVRLTAKK